MRGEKNGVGGEGKIEGWSRDFPVHLITNDG